MFNPNGHTKYQTSKSFPKQLCPTVFADGREPPSEYSSRYYVPQPLSTKSDQGQQSQIINFVGPAQVSLIPIHIPSITERYVIFGSSSFEKKWRMVAV